MRYVFLSLNISFILLCLICLKSFSTRTFTDDDLKTYRDKVKRMFYHAYDNYLLHAFPYDELQPISCKGMDTWGSCSLTLIDALDTLALLSNFSEFRRVVDIVLATADFDVNVNVSVFETNIRVVGGLLSAHLFSKRAGIEVERDWPCSGPLLRLAESIARRLLPAFVSNTGMPYGTVNLREGVPIGETAITCVAGVGTFVLEFGTLSYLTGDSVFIDAAHTALNALYKLRSPHGMVGNHINVQEGKWTALDSGIGGGVDSYFEYLVKGAILFQEPKLMKMFKEYYKNITAIMRRDDWHFWVSMIDAHVTMPTFQALEAFWPGLLTLFGDIQQATKTLLNYYQVWRQFGATPEIYDVHHHIAKRETYPLRPELIESIMYLYRATKDPFLLEMGVDILESIEHNAKTECGYATIRDVNDHTLEDRMESFFLAETTKYLYLLFDPQNFLHGKGSCGQVLNVGNRTCVLGTGGYVFNTEAHPIDLGALQCCKPPNVGVPIDLSPRKLILKNNTSSNDTLDSKYESTDSEDSDPHSNCDSDDCSQEPQTTEPSPSDDLHPVNESSSTEKITSEPNSHSSPQWNISMHPRPFNATRSNLPLNLRLVLERFGFSPKRYESFEYLTCPSLPFSSRFSLMGQVFNF